VTHAEKMERQCQARRAVMLALRDGPVTRDEIRPALKDLGNFGRPAGCTAFLGMLVAQGAILAYHDRQRPTGPRVDLYRLPVPVCKVCGCDEGNACVDEFGEACHWAEPELCSACAGEKGVRP
jgi:hypothetical protein